MGQQQHVKASKLEGAQVTSSSGQQVGTIKDAIINPTSGRIDFAILSVSSAAATSATTPGATTTVPGVTTTTPGATTTTPGATASTHGLAGGKQVAVPWMLLRTGSAAAGATTETDTVKFVFSGDTSKLQNAPTFNESTDLSQATWRQSVYSHYGLTSGAATGGSYSPGGRTTGSSTDPADPNQPGSTDPNRPPSSTDPNRPPGSTTDPNQPRSGSSGLGTDRDR
jgi:sporulation protein YlmC with PRC-barrel domain